MARGGHITVDIDYKRFYRALEATVDRVGRGTKKATIEMCREIMDESLKQVPRETNTLAKSAFYEVVGDYKTGFTGIMGYGGNGNPVNPLSGERASEYMVVVHEDLQARHAIGKAKFLEDPIRAYHKKVQAKASQLIFL